MIDRDKRGPVELLAPAGSFDSMKAALAAGADAVYMGGNRFGARAYADNPDDGMLAQAIDYVHMRGKKLYLTVNTLVKEHEMSDLENFLLPCYEAGLDAIIVQDIGVFSFVRENFPGLPIHASTQMTITGVYGAKMLAGLGAERIVTARELSLEEIAGIRKETDVEIETFIHGAMCYCYSGQCLFSSLVGGRSGNRGRCAQPCRLPYDVLDQSRVMNKKDEKYVLSMKDLRTLSIIPDIIEAGVDSLKIEGRMKSPRYTAGVVSIYRKYVDLYLHRGREEYRVEERDLKFLSDLFDRGGFTEGYYKEHNGKDMETLREKPSFREANQELYGYLDKVYVGSENKIPVRGKVSLKRGKPAALDLSCAGGRTAVEGPFPSEAKSQPVTAEVLKKRIAKTGGAPFQFESLEIDLDDGLFLTVREVNELRRSGLESLAEALVQPFRRTAAEAQTGPGGDALEERGASLRRTVSPPAKPPIHVSLERPETLKAVLECREIRRIYLDSIGFEAAVWKSCAARCHERGVLCMLAMPHIFRDGAERYFDAHGKELREAGFDGVLIKSWEEAEYLKVRGHRLPMIFDYGLYTMNRWSLSAAQGMGAAGLTLPLELNGRELEALGHMGEMIVYGRIPMMVTAQCVKKSADRCTGEDAVLSLRDRTGRVFPVKNCCRFCYNIIYNSVPLSLLGMEEEVRAARPGSLRLQFTLESPEETKEIINSFSDSFTRGIKGIRPKGEFTRGHLKRKVE